MNGLQRVTIEAGPSTFRELYRPPEVIHELWVSTYEGETPPEEVIGDPFPELDRDLPGYVAGSTRSVEEPSGRWSFRRWHRPARSIRLPGHP